MVCGLAYELVHGLVQVWLQELDYSLRSKIDGTDPMPSIGLYGGLREDPDCLPNYIVWLCVSETT